MEVRALIAHPMETGYRPGADGRVLPRDIIRRFACRYNGEVVFAAELHPAIAANPYLAFHTVATESGTLEFEWTGDRGFSQVERRPLQVT
ncbi:thiosulfate oxidation carrier complex protein SoxZ [Ramlibacter terrae]|uniref:Thiosulfate oxidation carrier complex protein SoxZ n=1 Tax=Ramlibacter terrae TaxID=2732511 RepID=A0ABX6P6X9_9BURK|nr:thiosulfate oxidation carrier complex protein SoxZ [Ramlibacter terrae]